jgi:hypothetical protein
LHAENETSEAIEADRTSIVKAKSHRTPASAASGLSRLLLKYDIAPHELKCGCCDCEPKIASTCSSLYCLKHRTELTLDSLTHLAKPIASSFRQSAKEDGNAKRKATLESTKEAAKISRIERN